MFNFYFEDDEDSAKFLDVSFKLIGPLELEMKRRWGMPTMPGADALKLFFRRNKLDRLSSPKSLCYEAHQSGAL